jgi:hypothetical protein
MTKKTAKKQPKTDKIQFRVTEYEKNRIMENAKRFAEGDVTRWILRVATAIPESRRVGSIRAGK